MRNISILIFFLLQGVGGQVLGQQHHLSIKADSVYDKLRYQKDDLLNEYHCNGKYVQAVQQAVLNKNLHGIYEAIIPNAQGLSNNGSAFTYAQDANKQTLGISAFFPFPNKRIFFHTEIYTEASNGLFNLYSSGSWNNNVAFGFGLSGVISSSQYINENCGVYDDERKMYADSILLDYANKLAVEINNLIEEKKILNDKIDSVLSIQNPKQIVSDTSNLNLTKKIKGLTKKINEYNELIEIAREEKSKAHFAEKLAEFDAKKNILYGYSVYWWNIHTSFANTTLNLADSVGTKDVYTKNHPTIRVNGSLMWNHLGKATLHYTTLGISTMRGNFLNDPTQKGNPALTNIDGILYVMADDQIFGAFDDLSKPAWQYTISFYHANFFCFKKTFGVALNASYNNILNDRHAPDYKKNYTLTVGPIFRMLKNENFAKATFGISAGFSNVPYKERAKDHFSMQAYVGIPFNIKSKAQNNP